MSWQQSTPGSNSDGAIEDMLAVQRHCRHSSSSQTDAYLRKYGVIVDTQVVNMPRFGAPGKVKFSAQ